MKKHEFLNFNKKLFQTLSCGHKYYKSILNTDFTNLNISLVCEINFTNELVIISEIRVQIHCIVTFIFLPKLNRYE